MTTTVEKKRTSVVERRTAILAGLVLTWVVIASLGLLWAAPSVPLLGGEHTAEALSTMRRAMLVLTVMILGASAGTVLAGVWRGRRWLAAFAVLLITTAVLAWSLLGDGCQNALGRSDVTAAQACWVVVGF